MTNDLKRAFELNEEFRKLYNKGNILAIENYAGAVHTTTKGFLLNYVEPVTIKELSKSPDDDYVYFELGSVIGEDKKIFTLIHTEELEIYNKDGLQGLKDYYEIR